MKRRDFALGLALTPLTTTWALAATNLQEGRDFNVLPTAQPVAVPGKIEVIEFFGYWCPHCNAFEPKLEAWVKGLGADVNFRRIPVGWQDPMVPYQKLYYALEAIGAPADVHGKVFKAYHEQKLRLDTEASVGPFAAAIGVDKTKLADALKAFTVASKIRMASQASTTYQIEGVPTLVVQGKYLTSPELAKGEVRALQVADALIQQAKAKR